MSRDIREIFEEIVTNHIDRENFYSIIGTAVNVDSTARTCDLEPIEDEAPRAGIRLQSSIDGTTGFVLIPKEGSFIVASFFDRTTGFVSLTTEIEKIHFEAGGEDLKAILNDLIGEIKNAIIQTPSGPGTVSDATKALLDAVDTRINKLFF